MNAPGAGSVLFTPVGPSRFRAPGEFSAGTRGPASMAASLHYPLPSTIAGALAQIAWAGGAGLGGCNPDFFGCVDALLKSLLGENYALRPGYLVSHGTVYAAVSAPQPLYVPLHRLPGYVACLLEAVAEAYTVPGLDIGGRFEKCVSEAGALRPRYKEFVGIKLGDYGEERLWQRVVEEGYMYYAADLDLFATFHNEASVAVEVLGAENRVPEGVVVRFGGEGYPARISVGEPIAVDKMGDGEKPLAALLLEPALLNTAPPRPWLVEPGILKNYIEESRRTGDDIAYPFREIAAVYTFSNQASLLIPGYTMKEDRLRKPRPSLPRGTIILGKGSPGKVYREGIGLYTRIGWGTLYPIEIPEKLYEKLAQQ